MEEVVGKHSPQWGRKNGRAMGIAPGEEEGQSVGAMPLHVAQVRCDNRGPEGAADERGRKPGSTAREGTGSTSWLGLT